MVWCNWAYAKKKLKFAKNNLPIYWYKTLVFTSIDNMNVSHAATKDSDEYYYLHFFIQIQIPILIHRIDFCIGCMICLFSSHLGFIKQLVL